MVAMPTQAQSQIRQTSIDAYNNIKANGLLSEMRFRVYEALFINGPLTGKELDKMLGTDSAHKRLSELKALGCIDDSGELTRTCKVSGERVIEWDVTDRLPVRQASNSGKSSGSERPTQADLGKAVDDLRELWKVGAAAGVPPSEALARVALWLAHGAP